MSSKRELRFNKDFRFDKPPEPKPGQRKFIEELLESTGDRAQYYPNGGNNIYDHLTGGYKDEIDYTRFPNPRQYISLKKVVELVSKENFDLQNIYFTASCRDDYINLEVIHLKELSEEEKLQAHREDMFLWEQEQNVLKEQELERIEREMKYLQDKCKDLRKKK